MTLTTRAGGEKGAAERSVHRELMLLIVLVAITAAAFWGTRSAASANRGRRFADAAAWYAQGEADRLSGRIDAAVAALRRAATMDPGRLEYQLTLARALAASGDRERARARLLELHSRTPDNATVSLDLARLSAMGADLPAAVRHYSDALSGLWPVDQADARRHVRLELIDLLLAHGRRSRALSEILVLAANLPDEPAEHVRAGRLFLAAGDPRHAAEEFTAALEQAPKQHDAITGAAEAAFENGNYAAALSWLDSAPNPNARQQEIQTIARMVLARDPLSARLTLAERRRRLEALVSQAIRRADGCSEAATAQTAAAAPAALRADAEALRNALESVKARVTREDIDAGFEVALRLELAIEERCAAAAPLDRAVLLIGRRHGLTPP
jgi:tetratricopeptide (TPR) repeat protein